MIFGLFEAGLYVSTASIVLLEIAAMMKTIFFNFWIFFFQLRIQGRVLLSLRIFCSSARRDFTIFGLS